MCAARARQIYERQAKERQGKRNDLVENLPPSESGKARDKAGAAFGVSGKSVDFAKRVIEKGIPELAKAVDEGRMAVSMAATDELNTNGTRNDRAFVHDRSVTYRKFEKYFLLVVVRYQLFR
jgi:hypothetical protein